MANTPVPKIPRNPISQKVWGALGGLTTFAGFTYTLIEYIPVLRNNIPPTLLPLIPSIVGGVGTFFGGWKATHKVTAQELQQALEYAKSIFGLIDHVAPISPFASGGPLPFATLPFGPGQSGPLLPSHPEPPRQPAPETEEPQAEVSSGYPAPLVTATQERQPSQETNLLTDDGRESGHDAG